MPISPDFVYRSEPVENERALTIFQDHAYPQLIIVYDATTGSFRKFVQVDASADGS